MNMAAKLYRKLRRIGKYSMNDMRSMFGANNKFFENARGARLLIYHGICLQNHTKYNSIFIQLKTFEEHLKCYKKYFNIISLDDYYNKKFSKERFNICVTFDDGFANNYKYVLPLMQKHNIPVSFFMTAIRNEGYDILWNDFFAIAQKYGPQELSFQNELFYKKKHHHYISKSTGLNLKDMLQSSDFNNKKELMNLMELILSFRKYKSEEDYWLQMTTEEIKILSDSPLATIGCHGYFHNDLTAISIDKATDEMVGSKHWLENITGKRITAFAFPYGAYSNDICAKAKLVGFTKLLATDFSSPDSFNDSCMQERFTINPYISINNQMTAIVNGKYE